MSLASGSKQAADKPKYTPDRGQGHDKARPLLSQPSFWHWYSRLARKHVQLRQRRCRKRRFPFWRPGQLVQSAHRVPDDRFAGARHQLVAKRGGPESIRCQLTFALLGARTVGVDMAGTLAEMSRMALAHDFRHNEPYLHTEPARVTERQFLKSLIQKKLSLTIQEKSGDFLQLAAADV